MPVTLRDSEIEALMSEVKQLPNDFERRLQLKAKTGHRERELSVTGEAGGQFRVVLRQSSINPLDFSVILGHLPPNSNTVFRLRRYNGKSHQHSNKLEGDRFYDFHIHYATERYQDAGWKEDSFAKPTDRFHDFQGALNCLFSDAHFLLPGGETPQFRLGL